MYMFFSDKPDSVEYDHLSGPTITCELERHKALRFLSGQYDLAHE